MPTTRRRDKLYVIAEVLEIARDGILKTQIMYRANLSYTQLNDYVNFMVKTDLLNKIVQDGKELYKMTEKGLDFLQRYREITELLSYYPNASKCPQCHKDISSDHKFCPYCGKNLRVERIRVRIK
jgi:predicted transcriptional regulator